MDVINLQHRAHKSNILYLVYRRLRPAFGLPLGFILMYGAYTGNISPPLLLVGFGFICIETMGGWYNDYWDYEEDMQNNRRDKFTTCGLFTRKQMRDFSFAVATIGLISLLFTNFIVFMLGLYYIILFIGYSHPCIRLKGHVLGYLTLSSAFLFLPIALNSLFLKEFTRFDLFFTLFCFFQFTYILCQKDSTDLKDKNKNLFLDNDWKTASMRCILFGALSSLFLLSVCTSITLLFIWGINTSSKAINLINIWEKKLTRELRARLILIEFLTPYLYLGVLLL